MDTYIYDRKAFELHYNCSFYDVDSIPLEKRQHIVMGWAFIILFSVTEILYIPCLFSMWKHLEQNSYKFMFVLGVIDVFTVWINGFFTGYFGITGTVFCTHPTFIFILGMIANFSWASESGTTLMLALNRCVEVLSPVWKARLYGGKRCWFWVALPFSYAIYSPFFTKTTAFSSILMSWFFNPHVGYYEDTDGTYFNLAHTIYNWFIAITLPSLYMTFFVLFTYKRLKMPDTSATYRRNKAQMLIFLQVSIITTANLFAASIFDYMQIAEITPAIIYLGQFMWFFSHATPPFIYWTLNKTIRNDCKRMLSRITGLKITVTVSTTTAKVSQFNRSTGRVTGSTSRVTDG
ncbi:serpentine type 7TM GPCR chemoreceptor srt domain-containing protein [Ditylenchus destructor]|uniref:Serpentine type 7TM GPCR chemoreceptor srt domain-containing protein n=1 Tax=Ditylenchus destructor TaxID=166010 RepID=A0AAD4MQC0_9BILA|nr:serpentine type 7TM GPCR chemoreceptor srt domain-containing protein [Ditylenchus destructor]